MGRGPARGRDITPARSDCFPFPLAVRRERGSVPTAATAERPHANPTGSRTRQPRRHARSIEEPSLPQRTDLDLAEEDLGAFGLEEDPAPGEAVPSADVDDVAVEDRRDRVAVAEDLHAVPLAGRLLDVAAATKAQDVPPGRVTAPPVEPARVARHGLPALLEVELAARPDARLAGQAGL